MARREGRVLSAIGQEANGSDSGLKVLLVGVAIAGAAVLLYKQEIERR